jgi:cytochrome c oxidase subunit 4
MEGETLKEEGLLQDASTSPMSKQLKILNIICVIAALGFLLMIVVTAVTAGDILTTDTLFIMTVCLVMAVMFAASPLLYLKSEGKLPLPGMKKLAAPKAAAGQLPAPAGNSSEQAPAATWGAISAHSAAHATPHVEEHFAGTNKLFISIWVWLVGLTLVEIFLAYKTMPIHIMLTILLGLSIIKAALIVAYFMHLKFERLSLILSIVPMLVICICLLFVFFPDSFRSSNLRYKFQEAPPVAPAPAEEP